MILQFDNIFSNPSNAAVMYDSDSDVNKSMIESIIIVGDK